MALWAGVAAAGLTACSYDWDRLEPARDTSNDSAGAPGQASGGIGSGSTGGSSAGGGTGGNSSAGGTGSGGTGGAPLSCSGSVLANSDFEILKANQPRDWLLLNNAADVECATETALVASGSKTAMRVDTRSAVPNDAYRAVIGNTSGRLESPSAAELTATLAVRVEELPTGGKVTLLALFSPDGNDFQELELSVLSTAEPSYVVVGGPKQLPAGTTEFGLAISVPAGALIYIDDACAAVE